MFWFHRHPVHLLPRPREVQIHPEIRIPRRRAATPGCRIDRERCKRAESYELIASRRGVEVIAHDAAGLFYGRRTLQQILLQLPAGASLPGLVIRDYPEFRCRGVMLDVSRDRIPTMEVLKRYIDQLSSWKINHFELYFEHAFAYRDHREVWEHASPFTALEIRELDDFCRERFIDFVPFQNSLGHMLRWLCHDRYRRLAECPEGFGSSWNMDPRDPFSLCPTDPASLEFVDSLLAELLPNFTSPAFMAGCDETYDIGEGRSREQCERHGRERVYLEYIKGLNEVVKKHGRKMMMCADILVSYPELVRDIPADVAMVDWGYGMDYPFAAHGKMFREAGLEFYLMMSNSTYSSVAGRTYRGLENIRNAAFAGMEAGAAGLINTEWGDFGHWHTWSAALPGIAYGAAMSWAPEANVELDLGGAADALVFGAGSGVGDFLLDLGRVYSHTAGPDHTCALFMLLYYTERRKNESPLQNLTPENLRLTRYDLRALEQRLKRLEISDSGVGSDLRQMLRFADFACACAEAWCADGEAEYLSQLRPEVQRQLAEKFVRVIEAHCALWQLRQRPGGMAASLWWFRRAWRAVCGSVPFPFETQVNAIYGEQAS